MGGDAGGDAGGEFEFEEGHHDFAGGGDVPFGQGGGPMGGGGMGGRGGGRSGGGMGGAGIFELCEN